MNVNVKNILVTGCSTGIGLDAIEALRTRGYRVIASARKSEDVNRLAALGFDAIQLDLNDSDSIRGGVAKVAKLTDGKIDALFNNAGFGQPGAVEDLTRDVLRQQFETNVFGCHELTCLILPYMRKNGQGRIIFNSSVLGFAAMRFRGAYNASKFALEGLVDTLRLELHGTNIQVVLIEPGPILSAFRTNAFELYKANINKDKSAHLETYLALEARLETVGAAVPFTLPASAVSTKVIAALESSRPRIRYYVTVPTYLFAYLKRLLPGRWLDTILRQVN
ncbi:MAG: SDR family NAD(P)-dependent oxidoreductase [Methylococcales bacterium]|jgi:NAD(P)-dependent dehydrogenase (short-subunit alcohol dehydrogenase family)|nr:SDR family NAD(P)-dependent oxidoreductase [Methylococcales bacterium]